MSFRVACPACGSEDISVLMWVVQGTGYFNDLRWVEDCDGNDDIQVWCCDCEDHFDTYEIKIKKEET